MKLVFFKSSEMNQGKKIEAEHKDTINKIKNNPKIKDSQAEEEIADDHIEEAKKKGYSYYSRLIASENLEDYKGIDGKIIKYFKENKNIKDETGIHKLAEELKINTHKLEEKIYAILKKIIGDKVSKSDNIQLGFFKSSLECMCGKKFPSKIAMQEHMKKLSHKEYMLNPEQEKATHHENKLGAGAKKRKKLHGKEKVGVVLHEFKHGKLHSGSGDIVKDRKQAVAIAMSEAGLSKKKIKKSSQPQITFFKNITGQTKASHKYIRKEGDQYIYNESEDKENKQEKPKAIGHLKLHPDGFYYDAERKITSDPEKAKQFVDKAGDKSVSSGKLKPEVGHTIRVKGTSKGLGKGIIATITEVNDKEGTVRIKDESGKYYRVKINDLEMTKSKEWNIDYDLLKADKFNFVFNLIKNLQGSTRPGHKWLRRTKRGDKYLYTYQDVEQKQKFESRRDYPTNMNFKNITIDQIEKLQRSKKLRNQFIKENQPLVIGTTTKILNKFSDILLLTRKDASQGGNVKFIEAIKGFDTAKSKAELEKRKKTDLNKVKIKYNKLQQSKANADKKKEEIKKINDKYNSINPAGSFLNYVQTSIARDLFQRITQEIQHELSTKAESLESTLEDKEGHEKELKEDITYGEVQKDAERKKQQEEDIQKYRSILNQIKNEEKLPPKTKKMIDLIIGGKVASQVDIAKKLGISKPAVTKKMDGLRKLAERRIVKSTELSGFLSWLKTFG
jgi:hypothetical protein